MHIQEKMNNVLYYNNLKQDIANKCKFVLDYLNIYSAQTKRLVIVNIYLDDMIIYIYDKSSYNTF